MTKNPLVNGLAASAYIVLVVTVMNTLSSQIQSDNKFLAPVAFLSMFTLSAAVMGYIFCFTPITLFLEGKKKQAATLFIQTIGVFAVLTLSVVALLFLGIVR